MIFPWQIKQWQILSEAKQKGRLPHALLLMGACDLEKKQFAEVLSASILCEKPDHEGQACGKCHACHLILAKSHPDLVLIEPEQTGHAIKVDQIRALIQQANETSMQGGFRVIIINPAHAMNTAAANALLKTLEEPAPKTLLILISNQSFRLPATVTSRCQKVVFQKPCYEEALQWLDAVSCQQKLASSEADLDALSCQQKLASSEANLDASFRWYDTNKALLLNIAEGYPLQALALMNDGIMMLRQTIYQGLSALAKGQADPLELAAKWQEHDMLSLFKLLLAWARDLMRFKLTDGQAELINSDYRADFAMMKLTRENVLNYQELVQQSYAKVVNLQNLNKQLLLEELLIRWTCYVPC